MKSLWEYVKIKSSFMKKNLLLIISFLINLNFLFGQCLPNGITTNPSAPVNTQVPSKTNYYFNWAQQYFSNNSTCQPLSQIESPFYKTDNLEALRQSKDMLPDDGWELIRRDLGYTDQNIIKPETLQHIYFILYNKYTGILRVLLKTCRGEDYNGVKISIQFDQTGLFQTSLLDLAHSSVPSALDQPFTKNPVSQSVTNYINDNSKWFYADFPMSYDPCTCMYQSKINIVSKLIQNSTINIEGAATGTLTSINNGKGTVSNDANKFNKVYNGIDPFINNSKSVISNLLPGTQTATNVNNALTSFQTALKSNDFLKLGLSVSPWLQSAVSLFDLFTGGGKTGGAQTVQMMPMAVNLNIKLNGNIETANQYHNITFTNPGSFNAQNDLDIYPSYNETLGVFNLLKGPKFRYQQYIVREGSPRTGFKTISHLIYKLKEPIKWVLNPASHLALQDAQVAFVLTSKDSSATPPSSFTQGFSYLEGKNANSRTWQYRTDYVDINCLGTENIFHFTQGDGHIFPLAYSMKFILNFKRLDNPSAQNVLLVLTYPISLEGTSDALTGNAFSTTCIGGAIAEATASEVNSFCTSSSYVINRQTYRVMEKSPATPSVGETVQHNIVIAPNPAIDKILIKGNTRDKAINSIQLYNSIGVKYVQQNLNISGVFAKELNISKLSKGVYFIKLSFSDGQYEIRKIVISR